MGKNEIHEIQDQTDAMSRNKRDKITLREREREREREKSIPLVRSAALLAKEGSEERGIHVVDHLARVSFHERKRKGIGNLECLKKP